MKILIAFFRDLWPNPLPDESDLVLATDNQIISALLSGPLRVGAASQTLSKLKDETGQTYGAFWKNIIFVWTKTNDFLEEGDRAAVWSIGKL